MKNKINSFIVLALLVLVKASQLLQAQNVLIGTVRDADGPLIGANVVIKGTNRHATVDTLGQFKLKYDKLPITIQTSFIGFQTGILTITEIPAKPLVIFLVSDNPFAEVVVTSRRRKEVAQDVPIPITVLDGGMISEAGAFNVNRLKELVPSVQLYSSNPRNTGLNVRGLGATFGLTNDGIEPGVGFYVDGVYYARPAATTLDFIDVEQIEVLRGPQGTLFGKNTTSGTFNVTTRKPSFTPSNNFELSYGNYGYIQAKTSISGPINKKIAGRISFSGTQRDGLIFNVATQKNVNDLNNLGLRGQLLVKPNDKVSFIFAADASRQRPDGFAQVFAGVAPTLRPAYRQFEQIIADLNYQLPSRNPFDRVIDHDTPWKSGHDLGGASMNTDIKLGLGVLTITSAWRYWKWDPSNDRDFTGLQALKYSQATSKHQQWSQELRWAGTLSSRLNGVLGVFIFGQELKSDPVHIEESGKDTWRFSQNTTSNLWKTQGLFDGFGIKTKQNLNTLSAAIFGQADYAITDRLSVLAGLRFNYDDKKIDFDRQTYGGLNTTDPALLALKNAVYTNQKFSAQIDDTNFSGQFTLSYRASHKLNGFATYAKSFKPVGLNLGGLPTANGQPLLALAVIKPESVNHFELGIKTSPLKKSVLNIALFNTEIKDYQTLVQSPEVGVNRGYLANAEKVRVRGVELDANVKLPKYIHVYGGVVYTDGKYVSFKNAPLPLEETGKTVDGKQVAFKDISGGNLPGISKWAGSLGVEFSKASKFLGESGASFIAFDNYYRSTFSSSPSPSKYLVVQGYALLNIRIGFKTIKGASLSLWGRNLLDKKYFEQLLPGAGNTGHYAGVLGDPRTLGVTIKRSL